jgi:hypothetical protein
LLEFEERGSSDTEGPIGITPPDKFSKSIDFEDIIKVRDSGKKKPKK